MAWNLFFLKMTSVLSFLLVSSLQTDLEREITRGQDLYNEGNFEDAIKVLAGAERKLTAETKKQAVIDTKLFLGVSYFVLGEKLFAEAKFADICANDPGYTIDESAFKREIVEFFRSAIKKCPPPVSPTGGSESPPPPPAPPPIPVPDGAVRDYPGLVRNYVALYPGARERLERVRQDLPGADCVQGGSLITAAERENTLVLEAADAISNELVGKRNQRAKDLEGKLPTLDKEIGDLQQIYEINLKILQEKDRELEELRKRPAPQPIIDDAQTAVDKKTKEVETDKMNWNRKENTRQQSQREITNERTKSLDVLRFSVAVREAIQSPLDREREILEERCK